MPYSLAIHITGGHVPNEWKGGHFIGERTRSLVAKVNRSDSTQLDKPKVVNEVLTDGITCIEF